MRKPAGPGGFGGIAQALRNPNYGLYTAGNAASLIGTWMQRIAVGWLTWQLTGSGAWLGAMAFADLFPTVIIGPIAGAAADRWDRLQCYEDQSGAGYGAVHRPVPADRQRPTSP